MADLKKGDLLEVRGPLGQGFVLDKDQDPILVAGGIGVAPLLFLADRLLKNEEKQNRRPTPVADRGRIQKGTVGSPGI